MEIVYKLKHKETGLYYKPGKGSNLDQFGKIYKTKSTVLNTMPPECRIFVYVYKKDEVYKKYGELIEEKAKMFRGYFSNDLKIGFTAGRYDFELNAFEETIV